MPGLNRTGPLGEGPMTGGGRGLCRSADTMRPLYTGYAGLGYGPARGWGSGRGGRWACRGDRFSGYGPYAAGAGVFPAAADEKEALRLEAERLRGALQRIDKRLAALGEDEEPVT